MPGTSCRTSGSGNGSSPVAYRKNLRGILAIPEIIPFWNIEKA